MEIAPSINVNPAICGGTPLYYRHLAVNRELVILYWQIAHEILTRQQELGWGAKVVTKLAKDLKIAFPEMKGFSRTNLLYMRSFANAYPDKQFVQQPAGQIP